MNKLTPLCCLLLFFSCSKTENPTKPDETTYSFSGVFNNVSKSGTGFVFFDTDTSSIHIRGYIDETGYQRQIDISIDTTLSGHYHLAQDAAHHGDIIGGDVLTNRFISMGALSDSLFFTLDKTNKHLTGSCNITFVDTLNLDTIRLRNGSFNIYY